MKTIVLVRHAKSSWDDASQSDSERPLNKRGARDAPFMAGVLRKKNLPIDLLMSSTAVRALTTAEIFAKELGYAREKIIRQPALYLADPSTLWNITQSLSDDYRTVALFGHNPGLTHLANDFSGSQIDNLPTCSFVIIDWPAACWKDITPEDGTLRAFEFPRKYSIHRND